MQHTIARIVIIAIDLLLAAVVAEGLVRPLAPQVRTSLQAGILAVRDLWDVLQADFAEAIFEAIEPRMARLLGVLQPSRNGERP